LCSLGIYFPRFGMLYQEKSGNPAIHAKIWVKVWRTVETCFLLRGSAAPKYICYSRQAGLPDGIPIFSLKIAIWVNFGGPCYGSCWYILWSFGLFCDHLEYFVVIWYNFSLVGKLYQEKSGNLDDKLWKWWTGVLLNNLYSMLTVGESNQY
jgi:hypothetical protein